MQYWTIEMEKQVGERIQAILGDDALRAVYQRFGIAAFRRSAVLKGLAKFLTEQGVRGARCFEIGTWNGLTAAVLSRFFDEVVTVDIAHNGLKHNVLAYLDIKNVRCVDIGSNEEKAAVASRLEFDFAFLDGNHAKDTEADWELARRCGRVLFDEAWPFQPPVWQLVNSLPPEQVTYGGAGLAIWDGRPL